MMEVSRVVFVLGAAQWRGARENISAEFTYRVWYPAEC